jgi:hypothetical protein
MLADQVKGGAGSHFRDGFEVVAAQENAEIDEL